MSLAYFKRFRMEISLYDPPAKPILPEGYFWVPWDESLIEHHALVKFHSFHEEIDAAVFPSLSHQPGCLSLMSEIRNRRDFLPEATWLVACGDGCCGTVQGIRERTGIGAIQNLGVTPAHRGQGIGSALVLQALHGFRRAGLGRAVLEVTAQNEAAVRLYKKLGFRFRKTVYKTVETGPAYSI